MGSRGPQVKPAEILKLRGTFRSDRHSDDVQPQRGKPAPIADLTESQRWIFDRVCDDLEVLNLLYSTDGAQLTRYAVLFARWIACERVIAEGGISYSTERGPQEVVELKESHRIDKALKQIEASFGLTPSARTRIRIDAKEQKPQDKARRFFGG